MKELPGIGLYEQTTSSSFDAKQYASAIMGSLANPPIYAMLSEPAQKIAQAASRALIVAEYDQRYEENSQYGRKHAGNLPLAYRFLEDAVTHVIMTKGENLDHENHEADRLLVNAMQAQNEAMSFSRIAHWGYNSDQDIMLNGHQTSDIKDQAEYDARLQASEILMTGKLGNDGCPSCGGLNTSHPEACGRNTSGELDGSTLALPRGMSNKDLEASLSPEIQAYVVGAKAAFEANHVDLTSPSAVYLVNYTETSAREAGVAAPVRDYSTAAIEVYRRAGMGENLSSRDMRGLGYSEYKISEKIETPEAVNDITSRDRVAAIGRAVLAVEPIAHKNSPAYERLDAMGIKRPAPGAEVALAITNVAVDLDNHVKNNATMILAAAESQYSAKAVLAIFTTINNHGDDKERMAKIEAAEPGTFRSFKFAVGDNEAMQETENLARGRVQNLDVGELAHYKKQIQERIGISEHQVEMIDKALQRPPVRIEMEDKALKPERVSFYEYDNSGEMQRYEGVVEDRFVDPDERSPRASLLVRMDDGSCQTPYEDECRPVKPAMPAAEIAQRMSAIAEQMR